MKIKATIETTDQLKSILDARQDLRWAKSLVPIQLLIVKREPTFFDRLFKRLPKYDLTLEFAPIRGALPNERI